LAVARFSTLVNDGGVVGSEYLAGGGCPSGENDGAHMDQGGRKCGSALRAGGQQHGFCGEGSPWNAGYSGPDSYRMLLGSVCPCPFAVGTLALCVARRLCVIRPRLGDSPVGIGRVRPPRDLRCCADRHPRDLSKRAMGQPPEVTPVRDCALAVRSTR
jgi:hypothetical protein